MRTRVILGVVLILAATGAALIRMRTQRLVSSLTPHTPVIDARVERDLSYDKAQPGDPKRRLDLYLPESEGKHPVLIFVHGGGWFEGDKIVAAGLGAALAHKGVLTACINYRLAPKYKHPAPVEDTARAVAWVRDNASKYGGDPNQIFLVGHSSAAHTVALLATDEKFLQAEGLMPKNLAGVVLLDGKSFDIENAVPHAATEDAQRFYRYIFGNEPSDWRQASPTKQATRGEPLPPFLIVYSRNSGAERTEMKEERSEELAGILLENGVKVELLASNESHGALANLLGSDKDDITPDVMRFIRMNSKAPGQ